MNVMSIKSQADFFLMNVHDYFKTSMGEKLGKAALPLEGFEEFSRLLKNIYSDYASYEISTTEKVKTKIGIMADDLENYHNLTNTLSCIYKMALWGHLHFEGEVTRLTVNKAVFKKEYKKSVTLPFSMLEKYSFYFKYYRGDREVSTYSLCTSFDVYYDNCGSLMEALKIMSERMPGVNVKEDYGTAETLFNLADYPSIVLGESTKRKNKKPLQPEILRTAGPREALWSKIVSTLAEDLGLSTDISLNAFVFPHWAVKFIARKRTLCTFYLYSDNLGVRLPLSYEHAKKIIQERAQLPESIRESISRFGCCGCRKCENKSNIELFEGVELCRLTTTNFITEDSRLIAIWVNTEDEVEAICQIIKDSLRSEYSIKTQPVSERPSRSPQ